MEKDNRNPGKRMVSIVKDAGNPMVPIVKEEQVQYEYGNQDSGNVTKYNQ